MKKFFVVVVLALSSICSWAYDVEVDGIYYNINSSMKTAEVTYAENNQYGGDVLIPESFSFKNTDLKVTSIGDRAFAYCSNLTSVEIPNSVTTIGNSAFAYCYNVSSVKIGNSVNSIGELAFFECTSIISVEIPNSVTTIGNRIFEGCASLASVTIGNSVTSIANSAFCQCYSLTSVKIPNSVISIGESAFWGCSLLSSITFGTSITSIGHDAFYCCANLTNLEIPKSVTRIEYNSFSCCSGLSSLTIPNSVSNIGHDAFSSCRNLEKVICYAENAPSMDDNVFADCYVEFVTLKVPETSVDLYKAAEQWKDFGTILPIEGTGINDINLSKSIGHVFNVSGQKVKHSSKGILIHDGKKYLVK